MTDHGIVRAATVVRATEALHGAAAAPRAVAPVYSLIVATGRCPRRSGTRRARGRRETFTDHRHLIVYGQRTADDRLVVRRPRRAVPLRLARSTRRSTATPRVFAELRAALATCSRRSRPADHPRVGRPAGRRRATGTRGVGLDPARVRLGGRLRRRRRGHHATWPAARSPTSSLGRDDPLTGLPWVGHRSRRWEPEPLRWLGVNAGLRLMTAADTEERLTGRPSVLAATCRGRWAAEDRAACRRPPGKRAVAPGPSAQPEVRVGREVGGVHLRLLQPAA